MPLEPAAAAVVESAVLIRLATAGDAAALSVLRWQWSGEGGAVSEPPDRFTVRFAEWMGDHEGSHEALVAVEEGQVVGMAWLAAIDRLPDPGTAGATYGDLQSVYLIPALRSAGHGSDLVRAVIARAEARGMAMLTVRPGRRSLPFYERLGFQGAGGLLQRTLTR